MHSATSTYTVTISATSTDPAAYLQELVAEVRELSKHLGAYRAWQRERRDQGFDLLHQAGLRPMRPRLPPRRREHQQPKLRPVR